MTSQWAALAFCIAGCFLLMIGAAGADIPRVEPPNYGCYAGIPEGVTTNYRGYCDSLNMGAVPAKLANGKHVCVRYLDTKARTVRDERNNGGFGGTGAIPPPPPPPPPTPPPSG